MKPDKHFAAAACIVMAAACLGVLTWIGTTRAIHAQRVENTARVTATLANQTLAFSEEVNRQILGLDQTLRILASAWQADPARFDLEAWRNNAVVLNGLSRDMILTDENGIIRQSSVNAAINQNASGQDYFRALADPSDTGGRSRGQMYIGPATIDGVMRQWHMNVARALLRPDGSFAGVIDTDYRIDAITNVFSQANLGAGALMALVGLDDGKLRGAVGAATVDPGASIADTPMFAAIRGGARRDAASGDTGIGNTGIGNTGIGNTGIGDTSSGDTGTGDVRTGDAGMGEAGFGESGFGGGATGDPNAGTWTGPSANDAIRRIHAFRRIPGWNLAVVVAMSEDVAMRAATVWREQAYLFAGCITALLAGLALALVQGTRFARQREVLAAEDHANLAASNAQLEVARAMAFAKAEQLEATLAGMSDGVSMIDAHMCLVEWNERFPEIAGVPAGILRVGLAMEEILRAQIGAGQFGWVADPEAEVERRMARLRTAPFGVTQRQRPDGHTVELRRNRLPDGGFVTLYTDVTEHRRAEQALRQAMAAAETANAEKSRFVAIVSHEIRTPLNALLNTVRLLSDSVLAPAQRSLLAMARQSGDALFTLISDILDISQMEAGKLSIRPSLFELHALLDSSAELFAAQAAERGIEIRVAIAAGTPPTLLADPGRLRQVLLNLLSNAVKYAGPGKVLLTAEPGQGADEAIRLNVKDAGPVIAPEARAHLFHPFSRLNRPEGDNPAGTGLGLSICHQLTTLMGGVIGYEAWRSGDGKEGNAFWITLPAAALPFHPAPGEAHWAGPTGQALADPALADPALADPALAGGVLAGGVLADPEATDRDLAALGDLAVETGGLPRRKAPRTRILLTDDIAANQIVTATLLRREGHLVDVAPNGRAAIEAIQSRPYDLVFMDIFMPGMSGQEAIQIIRSLPEPARSTPIIALTANAGSEDAALLKAAGTDGVLGKPVSLASLLAILDRHVWSGHAAAAETAVPKADASPEPARLVPILAAARISELRANLPSKTFAALIEECLLDMDHRMPALRRALLAGAPAAITAHAHALVGMAAGYGMAAMEARLRWIMTAVRTGDMMALGRTAAEALETDFTEASNTLREMLRHEAA